MFVFILSWSIIVFCITGPYSNYFSTLSLAFGTIFENSIGITHTDEDFSLFPKNFRAIVFVISIGDFFVKLLMVNFSLVIIFYFYRKKREKNEAGSEEAANKENLHEEQNNVLPNPVDRE
jgi:predicted histidine transporter YuiF (NhaC family)